MPSSSPLSQTREITPSLEKMQSDPEQSPSNSTINESDQLPISTVTSPPMLVSAHETLTNAVTEHKRITPTRPMPQTRPAPIEITPLSNSTSTQQTSAVTLEAARTTTSVSENGLHSVDYGNSLTVVSCAQVFPDVLSHMTTEQLQEMGRRLWKRLDGISCSAPILLMTNSCQ